MNNIPQKPAEQNGVGPVIGSVIVIVVVVIGGFYFWGNKIVKDKQTAEIQNQAMSASHDMNADEINIDVSKLEVPEENLNNLENEVSDL